jgi:hypothetical protein
VPATSDPRPPVPCPAPRARVPCQRPCHLTPGKAHSLAALFHQADSRHGTSAEGVSRQRGGAAQAGDGAGLSGHGADRGPVPRGYCCSSLMPRVTFEFDSGTRRQRRARVHVPGLGQRVDVRVVDSLVTAQQRQGPPDRVAARRAQEAHQAPPNPASEGCGPDADAAQGRGVRRPTAPSSTLEPTPGTCWAPGGAFCKPTTSRAMPGRSARATSIEVGVCRIYQVPLFREHCTSGQSVDPKHRFSRRASYQLSTGVDPWVERGPRHGHAYRRSFHKAGFVERLRTQRPRPAGL